jgi:hypothetical protein
MSKLPNLHDSILIDVNLEWKTAIARLTFELSYDTSKPEPPPVVIQASGVTDMKCPRLLPWGPSIYVNAGTLSEIDNGQLISIEMQSGDLIQISCREFEIK